MNDPNRSRIYLSTEVDVNGWEVGRTGERVTLNLRQQNGGYVAVMLNPVQAHEIGKLLLVPEIASYITARERGTAGPGH